MPTVNEERFTGPDIVNFLMNRCDSKDHQPEIGYNLTRRRWVLGCLTCNRRLCRIDEPAAFESTDQGIPYSEWRMDALLVFRDSWMNHCGAQASSRPLLFLGQPESIPMQPRRRKAPSKAVKPAIKPKPKPQHVDRKFNFDL